MGSVAGVVVDENGSKETEDVSARGVAQALEHPENAHGGALRGLIDAIVLTPDDRELQIELKGNLAAMLWAATNAKRSPETGDLSVQVIIGCGGGI